MGRNVNHQEGPVRVLFPPQFEPFQAYLSGPYLKAILGHFGIESSFFDANINFYNWLVKELADRPIWPIEKTANNSYLQEHIELAIKQLHSPPTDLHAYRWAINVIDEYLSTISPIGVRIGLTSLRIGNRYSSSDLLRYLEDPNNIYKYYFSYSSKDILGKDNVSTYLISVVVIDQLPAAISFAHEIKQHRPNARVIVGGTLITGLYSQISSISWIAQSFDAIIPGEACRALPKIFDLSDSYFGHITPDFSDLDLDQYWSCRRVLPYLVAHGCKWGKCSFCSHHQTYEEYRSSTIPEVINDLKRLSEKHSVNHFSFCDEHLTPVQLDELSSGVLQNQLNVKWSTFVRAESEFQDISFCKKLYDAGCRMLMFGLESGSQRILNAMNKGTNVKHFRPILEACKATNIAVRNDFMVGFPGEQKEEAQKTYSFISNNRDVIDTPFSSYAVAAFEVRNGAPLTANSGKFHVHLKERLRGDLDEQFKFSCDGGGLCEEERLEWRNKVIQLSKMQLDMELICPPNKTHQLILKDLYDRGLIFLPVCEIKPEKFPHTTANISNGVEIINDTDKLRVANMANGGEIEVDCMLKKVFYGFMTGITLEEAFQAQQVMDHHLFAQFITFLYRNEYISVCRISETH